MRLTSFLLLLALLAAVFGGFGPDVFDTAANPVGPADGSERTVAVQPIEDRAGEAAFSFDAITVERCGTRCVAMTAAVTNQQARRTTDVSVTYRVYAGKEPTGTPVWTGHDELGVLEAHATKSVSQRATVSMPIIHAVQAKGGWLAIEIVVESPQARTLFRGTEHAT